MKLFGYIYKHTNKINGKVYIGQTIQVTNVQRRFRHEDSTHHAYKSCPAFFNALNKYGWNNFETELIYSAFDQQSLNKAEEFCIKLYDSVAPSGYNSSMMVDGSIVFTPEIKKKMSDKRKEYYKNLEVKPVAANKKEHLFIDGIAHKNCAHCKTDKPLNEFIKNARRWDGLHCYCKECNKAKDTRVYTGLSEQDFKKSYEDRQAAVSAGVKKSFQDNPELRAKKAKEKSKPVVAKHIESGIEVEFNSAKEASQYGFNNTNIGQAIKLNKVYKKHTWRFK